MTETAVESQAAEATSVALERIPPAGVLEQLFDLPNDSFHYNGLSFETANMARWTGSGEIATYETWARSGHLIGTLRRWTSFALGDWLNWGAERFGGGEDIWAQAAESSPAERYDVAQRVTGLRVETLRGYATTCAAVPLGVRRTELSYSAHTAVTALDPVDQIIWLERAVMNGWSEEELRREIKDELSPPSEVLDPEDEPTDERGASRGERAIEVIQLAVARGQQTSDGGLLLGPEVHAQMRAVLGEAEE